MPVGLKISHENRPIISTTGELFCSFFDGNAIDGAFVLLHFVPAALALICTVLVVDIDCLFPGTSDYSPLVLIVVVLLNHGLTGPMREICDHLVVPFELLHPGSVLYINCEDSAVTVSHEQFPFSVV